MEVDKFRLIELVRERPLLWDFRRLYKMRNNKKIDELWQEIGKILDVEASSCKLVWQKLRSGFLVKMKRIPTRIANAKRKGTYNPRKIYSGGDLYDALKFLADGCSLYGGRNSDQEQTQKVKNFENVTFPRESKTDSEPRCEFFKSYTMAFYTQEIECGNPEFKLDTTNNFLDTVGADSEPKCEMFKSYSMAFYTQEIECENPKYKLDVAEKYLHNEIKATNVPKPEQSFSSANYIERNKPHLNNNNCHLVSNVAMNSHILVCKNEADFADNKDVSILQESMTKPELDLGNISHKSNQQAFLEGTISRVVDSCDLDYKFLYSLLPQLKKMSHLQKLKFRAHMSIWMLDIFSSSVPVKDLDKRVLLSGDNDPDMKFLISYLPFLKSMPLAQNLEFRTKIADLIYNILSQNESCKSASSSECYNKNDYNITPYVACQSPQRQNSE